MWLFYEPKKKQKNFDFLVFLGSLKWEHWPEIDESKYLSLKPNNHFLHNDLPRI